MIRPPRLFIEKERIIRSQTKSNLIELTKDENHYLSNVIRLRVKDRLYVIDGVGNLWVATLVEHCSVQLNTSVDQPQKHLPKPSPLIGLGVVLPKKDFDSLIRMTCEMGVDIVQPVFSDYSVIKNVRGKEMNIFCA